MKKNDPTFWAILWLLAIIVVGVLMSSCSSKSGQRKQEKVVILDSYAGPTHNYNQYTYRVKRIEHGVISQWQSPILFEVGDTVYATY
jgi:hypothetical protein